MQSAATCNETTGLVTYVCKFRIYVTYLILCKLLFEAVIGSKIETGVHFEPNCQKLKRYRQPRLQTCKAYT